MNRLEVARVGAYAAVVLVGSWGIWSVQAQQDRLEETRAKVLCPLYSVFLQSDTPEARARAVDPEAYDRALDVIRAGAETLHCEQESP